MTETKIPTKDITYVGFKSTGTSRGGSSHCLLFLGKDNRLIKRIDGYKSCKRSSGKAVCAEKGAEK